MATSTAVYRNPLWDEAFKSSMLNGYDLAIVKFDHAQSSSFAHLAAQGAAVNDEVTIVGYGLNYVPNKFAFKIDKSSAGVKRVGETKIRAKFMDLLALKGTTYTSNGAGLDAVPSHGDSGGPMFKDGELVGVASVGGRIPIIDFAVGFYVDLTTEASRQFLAKFL